MSVAREDHNTSTSNEAALSELEAEQTQNAVAAIERIMAQQASDMRASTGARRHGTVERKVEYGGRQFVVRVPRLRLADGKYGHVPLYDELKPRPPDVAAYRTAGVSTRGVGRLLEASSPNGAPRGTSSSNVQRRQAAVARERLETINTRPLGPEEFVAAFLDVTALDGRSVLVAQGVTSDGRKLTLGVEEDASENHELVVRMLDRLVERGFDPRVLWVVDGGDALWKGIREHAGPDALIQNCVVHFARKLRKPLGDELREKELADDVHDDIRQLMYRVWRENDAEVALAQLRGLADELDLQGLPKTAKSLRNRLEETLTVTRLGLSWETRQALRLTNSIESAMNSIDRQSRDVMRWMEGGDMRLLWTAWALLEAESRWSRVADPPDLLALRRQLAPDAYDHAPRLTRLPPTFKVRQLVVPTEDQAEARRLAVGSLHGPVAGTTPGPAGPIWLGSAAVLDRLGLKPGDDVSTEQLALAFQGRHVVTGDRVRQAASFDVERGDDAEAEHQAVTGVDVLDWRLEASEPTARLWEEGDANRRAEIERALLESAETALERITKTDKPGRGLAAAATVSTTEGSGADGPRLAVHGVVFGTARGRGKLASPVTMRALQPAEARRAADAARDRLNAELHEPSPQRAQAADGSTLEPASHTSERGAKDPTVSSAVEPSIGGATGSKHHETPPRAAEPPPPARQTRTGRSPPASEPAHETDPLDVHRHLLGGGRAANVEARVEAFRAQLGEKSDEWLVATRTFLGAPFARLDRGGARMTLRLERDLAIAKDKIATARREGHGAAVDSLQRSLGRMREQERTLRDSGRHLDTWMRLSSQDAAEAVAIERTLSARGITLDWSARDDRAAAARNARAGRLDPHRALLGADTAAEVETSAEWPAAWLQDSGDDVIAARLDELGSPLQDMERAMRGDGEPLAETQRGELLNRAARWLALEGEADARELAARELERQAVTEPSAASREVGQADPKPVSVELDAVAGVEI